MKKVSIINIILLTLFLVFFIPISSAIPTAPAGKTWEVVPQFTDEFDAWDDTKWYKEMWDYGSTPVHMVTQNAGVTDGKLWIKATLSTDATLWMNSSRVASKNKISFPMYMECSMKANSISSYNTFWLNNGNSANRNEIDMCESNANPSMAGYEALAYTLNSQYFIVKNSITERAADNYNSNNLSASNPLRGVHWDAAYHTIGLWWKDARNVQFYLDGEEAGHVVAKQDFTLSMEVIWDVWTQNTTWVGGLPSKNDLLDDTRNTMYVDWIHTYTLVNSSTSIESTPIEICLNVYPNPTSDILNINLSGQIDNNLIVKIYNTIGCLIKTEELQDLNNKISLSDLSKGVYLVKVTNGNLTTSKLIVLN